MRVWRMNHVGCIQALHSFIATTMCALTSNHTQSRKSKCVWLSTSIIVNCLWWVAHYKRSTTEYRLWWREHKRVGSTVYASWIPIPDGFCVVWEGPPYRRYSLGSSSKCRRRKGLKTVCIAPARTSDGLGTLETERLNMSHIVDMINMEMFIIEDYSI